MMPLFMIWVCIDTCWVIITRAEPLSLMILNWLMQTIFKEKWCRLTALHRWIYKSERYQLKKGIEEFTHFMTIRECKFCNKRQASMGPRCNGHIHPDSWKEWKHKENDTLVLKRTYDQTDNI